jgi:ATP-binding cassette subfamily B protein
MDRHGFYYHLYQSQARNVDTESPLLRLDTERGAKGERT